MKRQLRKELGLGMLLCSLLVAVPDKGLAGAAEEATALQADHEFVRAAVKGDAVTASKLVDGEFTWTDADGRTLTRTQALNSLPTPALGDEAGAHVARRAYGQVEAIMVDRDKIHILRVWVKRGAAWRLLVYHEVALGREGASPADSGTRECENPCKTVPYKPKNEVEQEVLTSWEAVETAVANHDAFGWVLYIANEFTMLGSTNEHPLTKADRVATLNLQKQTGRAALPPPVVSVQMFDFGDSVVMTCLHQPYTGKPVRVSRVWIKRDGKWMMSLSFQTTIEAVPAKSS
ncbi:MAG TPA: nuclear transport factor 2 family protein [Candidatus Sulfotelmatobacter sp.]|nr:nuclear transport factor 2 family protein [Candidatus Sulfotelmatobacter sp.]